MKKVLIIALLLSPSLNLIAMGWGWGQQYSTLSEQQFRNALREKNLHSLEFLSGNAPWIFEKRYNIRYINDDYIPNIQSDEEIAVLQKMVANINYHHFPMDNPLFAALKIQDHALRNQAVKILLSAGADPSGTGFHKTPVDVIMQTELPIATGKKSKAEAIQESGWYETKKILEDAIEEQEKIHVK